MRPQTGKSPQAPSNRPLQPLKRQGNINLGQPRKLCLLGGVLPRAIEHRPPRSTFSIFSTSVFSTPLYFRGRPKFRILGRFAGALRPRPTSCSRLPVARNRGVSRVSVISRQGFDFPDFRCKLYGLFENAPIPQEVKGMADGDSLRQLFSFSGLTFARVRGIVRYILSETGVGPVPILPVVSHMFPPAFLRFELRESRNGCF